ncbi:4-oxalocrotonate decarboxylase [Kangiella spongicola]|uniref:4-oxalocrotonate decarboxylase n=2 Tax=Kangiella spongicola TaxID=796379 RepID=A0A318D8I2_9GAMM|nr:4-oxalocrotonate decarboxylase [Kangiella spongicola]
MLTQNKLMAYCMKNTNVLLPLFSVFLLLSGCMGMVPDVDQEKLVEDAYSLQRLSVLQHAIKDPIIGFKAGLTSEAAQDAFNVDEPLVGALFASGFSRNRSAYVLGNYHDLRMEVELGFLLNQAITKPITKEELPQYIRAVVPIVELPHFRFTRNDQMTALTLITSNVASNQFIMGNTMPYDSEQIDQIKATLTKNGVTINQGKATDAMGSQKDTLVWMINKLLEVGYTIDKDHLLITGALGTMLPAEKGQYEAYFGTDQMKSYEQYLVSFSIR